MSNTDVIVISMKSNRAINEKFTTECVGDYPYGDYQRQVRSDTALNKQESLIVNRHYTLFLIREYPVHFVAARI
jgi:hypothetical protein